MRPHLIGHLDADCFYVSAERVRLPFLRHRPVGVLGNQGACVIAKSYEMKALGVKTGEPIWEARVKCPEGVYVKRDFRWYEALSRRMLAAVREASPAVEYYSIDEFFFDAGPPAGLSAQGLAEALRDGILEAVGVPVTVGVARSKSLAKLISDTAKPFGALALTDPDAERALLDRLPVSDVTGIAARRAARLAALGIRSCLDFALADRKAVRKHLTVVGEELWWELNGTPVRPLHTERPPHKILSRGGSLGEATADPDRLHAWLARNAERLVEELEYHVVAAGRLQVYVGHRDAAGGGCEIDLAQPTDRFDRLMEAGRHCLARAWAPGRAVNRMHLIATRLRRPGFVQQGLFEPPDAQARAVAQLKRQVNAKVGRFALRSGATLPLYDVYRDREQGYDVCDVRGKMCFEAPMLTAIALPYYSLPLSLIERHGLDRLAHERGGGRELQFHFAAAGACLPVWHEGQLRVVRWGCRRGESRSLPVGGCTRQATVESGYWSSCGAEEVEVPAALGYDGGVWYAIRRGVCGVLVGDERGAARAYLVCEPASHYYAVMTRSAWMPVLIGERI